jgi:hypothetical protein
MPRDVDAHQNCPGVSTSQDPGTDSCAPRYGTGAQPAGMPDPADIERGDASAPLIGASTAPIKAATAVTHQPRRTRCR